MNAVQKPSGYPHHGSLGRNVESTRVNLIFRELERSQAELESGFERCSLFNGESGLGPRSNRTI
jgi:23S rRNA-/tRNA-specific pseudouridylate synthase